MQVEYLSFDNQISYFEETKNAMIGKIGKKAAEEVVNGAIFQIGLGKITELLLQPVNISCTYAYKF
jgi:hypothetical protein